MNPFRDINSVKDIILAEPIITLRGSLRVKHFIAALLLLFSAYSAQSQSLEELFSLAESNNKSIRVSEDALKASSQAYEQSLSLRLPDINASLALGYNGPAFITDRNFTNSVGVHIPEFGNNFSLKASQVIYAGGSIDGTIKLSQMGMQMSLLDVEKNRQEVRLYIAGLYLDLVKLNNTVKVIQQNILLSEQILQKTKARVEQGTSLKNDITRYELQIETLRLHKLKVEASISVVNHSLCQAVGLEEGYTIRPDELTLSSLPTSSSLPTTSVIDLQDTSPIIRQASLAVDMASQRTRLAKSERLPKIALVAEYNLNGPITIEIPAINKNFNYWFVGLGLQYNISSLFKSKHDIKRAALDKEMASDALALTREKVSTAIFAAQTELNTAHAELATCDKQVQLAHENYSVVLNPYQNGVALVTDRVDASNMKLASEVDREGARINILFCQKKLQYLQGTL